MEWDQAIFKKVLTLAGHLKKKQTLNPNRSRLSELKDRLTIVSRMLTGDPVEIVTAEAGGGFRNQFFFLPAFYEGFESRADNDLFFFLRVCCLAEQRRMGLNWSKDGQTEEESISRATGSLEAILSAVAKKYPSMRLTIDSVIRTELATNGSLKLLAGKWMAPIESSGGQVTPGSRNTQSQKEQKEKVTEIDGKTREDVRTHTPDTKAIEDYTLSHNFEKAETIEEFNGTWRSMDGEDDLSDHEEALKELDLRDTVRVDTPAHSVYRTEFFVNASAPESASSTEEGTFIPYDEWDYKIRSYKKAHCRIYPGRPRNLSADYVRSALDQDRGTLARLRRTMSSVNNEMEQVRRQSSGEEPDLDALVDNFSELAAGKTPSEKVYLSRRKRKRDLAVLILLDISLSTDAYTGGERILDVEKRSVALLSEILAESEDDFAIDAFFSKTRNHISYLNVKRFSEGWAPARGRLGGLEATGYTRIGPAIRHATAEILSRSVRKKWILLLSDGKPNDYDRYEGRYGMADVRRALKEARNADVHTFALAVEASARHYLPLMLGQGRYRILPHPSMLPEALTEFYARLRAG